jgi:hypothetical protein
VNFLTDAIGGTAEDLLSYPGYVLLSLSDVVGPRYYYLARHPGWLDSFSDAATGSLDLRRVMQPSLEAFLQDVAQVGVFLGKRGGWAGVMIVSVVGWGAWTDESHGAGVACLHDV